MYLPDWTNWFNNFGLHFTYLTYQFFIAMELLYHEPQPANQHRASLDTHLVHDVTGLKQQETFVTINNSYNNEADFYNQVWHNLDASSNL